jgi:tight adherence protein B
MKLRAAVAGITLVVAAVAAQGAPAADSGFTLLEGGGALFPDRAYVVVLDKRRPLTDRQVHVTENGKTVRRVTIDGGSAGVGTVLLIDASNSMKSSIDQAMAAARNFAARNPGTPLSVVTFNAKPKVVLPLTSDKQRIKAALASTPKLAEGTHMWDALSAAQTQIRGAHLGAGRIVLVSDGADVGSTTSKQTALDALAREKVRVYAVGIDSKDFNPDDLKAAAAETSGVYALATSNAALQATYGRLGRQAAREYLLRYSSPAAPGTDVKVAVGINGLGAPVTTSYTTPSIGSATPYKPRLVDRLMQSWLTMLLMVFLIVALLAYAVTKLFELSRHRSLRRRLGRYVSLDESDAKTRKEEVGNLLAQTSTGKMRFSDWDWASRMEVDLQLAGISRTPQSVVFLTTLATVLVAFVCAFVIGPVWGLLAIAIPFLVKGTISRKARKQRDEFADQLPDNLEVLASALRAGHSLAGAMSVVVEEAAQPSKDEFRRIVTDEQLGIALDETLEVTARRMDNRDMEQVAVVALLQRDAGGNMAEVLDRVIENIRARQEIIRLVRTLTAQGRLSRWILSLLPVFVLLMILLINPDYLQPMFDKLIGQVALVFAGILVLIGSLFINKIVKIRV